MKKFIVSMGLAAAGTASLQAAYTPDMSDTSKIWTVSASLRSFYDDNYTTASNGPNKKGSFGIQVSPQFELNVPLTQTELGMRYIYGLSYYEERDHLGQSPYDQTHQLDLWADHAFNERWHARAQDSFVSAQDPGLINAPGTPGATLQRVQGNNIDNTAKISVTTDWTDLFSTVLSYKNSLYDYQNKGGNAANPSLAGLLNRDENLVSLDLQWHVMPTTTAFVGYQYGQVVYNGGEQIGLPNFTSSSRDTRSHYGYVGVQHSFLDNLKGTVDVGVQYTEDYNDPTAKTQVNPYANASLVYTYASGSYAEIGLTHTRNSTVIAAVSAGSLTLDQESTLVYGSVNHQLTSKLVANAMASFQDSAYNGGLYNGQSDDYYSLGLSLTYKFTRNFSAEGGYNFDDYVSGIPGQAYTRNRVFLGVTATF